MTKGWYGNRQKHSLASKGISTKRLTAKGTGWKHKLNINQYIYDWDENIPVSDVAQNVAKELRKSLYEMRERGQKFENFPNLIIDENELDYFEYDLIEQFESMKGKVPASDFDFYLEDLYNWADANRVWLGM